jgi:hypothetical protein
MKYTYANLEGYLGQAAQNTSNDSKFNREMYHTCTDQNCIARMQPITQSLRRGLKILNGFGRINSIIFCPCIVVKKIIYYFI